jgi:hypothetical protein
MRSPKEDKDEDEGLRIYHVKRCQPGVLIISGGNHLRNYNGRKDYWDCPSLHAARHKDSLRTYVLFIPRLDHQRRVIEGAVNLKKQTTCPHPAPYLLVTASEFTTHFSCHSFTNLWFFV